MTLEDPVRREACLREAGAAAQAARQGTLAGDEAPDYRANALARCDPLPADQRKACIRRILGAGTVRGSVEEGGLYRELRLYGSGVDAIPIPAASDAPVPTETTIIAPRTVPAPVIIPSPAKEPSEPSRPMSREADSAQSETEPGSVPGRTLIRNPEHHQEKP